jgi:hypothetical protein
MKSRTSREKMGLGGKGGRGGKKINIYGAIGGGIEEIAVK